jgi:hypothetical protein
MIREDTKISDKETLYVTPIMNITSISYRLTKNLVKGNIQAAIVTGPKPK